MKERVEQGVRQLPNDWVLPLACGHDVSLPWDSPVPLMMGCVIRHQRECVEGAVNSKFDGFAESTISTR